MFSMMRIDFVCLKPCLLAYK